MYYCCPYRRHVELGGVSQITEKTYTSKEQVRKSNGNTSDLELLYKTVRNHTLAKILQLHTAIQQIIKTHYLS